MVNKDYYVIVYYI